jgi:hypothetical protein
VCYQYRVPLTRTAAALAAASLLAFPAASLAQSAGDNQYQDPLAGQHQQTSRHTTTAKPAPAPAPAPAAAPTNTTPAPAAPASTSAQAQPVPLARTGLDAWIPALAGLLLVAAALALRRSARGRRA